MSYVLTSKNEQLAFRIDLAHIKKMLFLAIIFLPSINSTFSLDCCDEIYLSAVQRWSDRQFKYSDLSGKYIKQQDMFNEHPYYRKTCTSKSLKGTSITRMYYLIYYRKGTAIEKGKLIIDLVKL